jgi:hypothetical protein
MARKQSKRLNSASLDYDPALSKQFSKGAKIKRCFDNCVNLFILEAKKLGGGFTNYYAKAKLTQIEVCSAYGDGNFPVWDYGLEVAKDFVKKNPKTRNHPAIVALLGNNQATSQGKKEPPTKRKN